MPKKKVEKEDLPQVYGVPKVEETKVTTVGIYCTDSKKTVQFPVETAMKALKYKPLLYELKDNNFKLEGGQLSRQSNTGSDKDS